MLTPIRHHFQTVMQYSGHYSLQPSLATSQFYFSLLLGTEVPTL